jgi:hypothetical protein
VKSSDKEAVRKLRELAAGGNLIDPEDVLLGLNILEAELASTCCRSNATHIYDHHREQPEPRGDESGPACDSRSRQ